MEQTEMVKKQAERAEEEVKKQLEAASKEGQEVIVRAVKTGEEIRREAQEQAKQDAEVLIARARTEIQRERDDAIDELRKGFGDLTIMAAEKVVDRSLDKEAHRKLIDKVLEESETLKKG
jgi:F-type H+-transporting ATPase subunit b